MPEERVPSGALWVAYGCGIEMGRHLKLNLRATSLSILAGIFAFGWTLNFATVASAEREDADHAEHLSQDLQPPQSDPNPLGRLQRALDKNNRHLSQTPQPKRSDDSGIKGLVKPSTNVSPAPGGGMAGGGMVPMMGQMMAQTLASQTNAQTSAEPKSELPGYPGASHIYHVGATGFFADHANMVNLTPAQLTSLNRIMEKSLLAQSSFDRKIQRSEEELWTLTASDQPIIKSIEAKVREIESLKGEKRITFIRNVGQAANILTPAQRSILIGKDKSNSSDGMNSKGDM